MSEKRKNVVKTCNIQPMVGSEMDKGTAELNQPTTGYFITKQLGLSLSDLVMGSKIMFIMYCSQCKHKVAQSKIQKCFEMDLIR